MNASSKKIVHVRTSLCANGTVYPGTIENVSDGIMYVTAASKNASSDFLPGNMLDVNLSVDEGEARSVKCRVKWSYKTPPYGITDSLGVEVLDNDSEYEAILQIL